MLETGPIDAVVLITPHNTHAALAIQAANAGKHAITEKPMCITIAEADAMIAAHKKAGTMLSVYHNRRWDGDHLTMMDVIEKGLIGDIIHLEACFGGYHKPGTWWRSIKEVSGGAFYDWGAHFLYWVLRMIPQPIDSVTGFYHENVVWKEVTNEDQVQAMIRFKNGAVADVQMSSVAMFGRARFRILGTKGAILDEGKGSIKVKVDHEGYVAEFEQKYRDGQHVEYYKNIADHLLRGKALEITPESSRRVIAVMDLAERSSKTGAPQPMPGE
jgi:predicted dehydrogenase